jgi:hypothetical protein
LHEETQTGTAGTTDDVIILNGRSQSAKDLDNKRAEEQNGALLDLFRIIFNVQFSTFIGALFR